MRKGLDRMWDGMIKDKIRQDGFLSDMSPKWWSVLIWIIIGIIFFGNTLTGETRPSIKRIIITIPSD
jgi:hypothetical protein